MNFKKIIFFIKLYISNRGKVNVIKKLSNVNFSYDQILNLNFQKRKNIVDFAYYNIPFYKKYYDSNGFHPNDLKCEEDWLKVPIINKNHIKTNFSNFYDSNVPKKYYFTSSTGGSTGVPLSVYFDKRFPFQFLFWRVLNWWNVNPWDNQAYIFRSVGTNLSRFINKLKWWPTKRLLLDCSSVSTDEYWEFYNKILKVKPSFIQGYVGGLFDFAEFLNKNKLSISGLKAVWVTSSPLSEPTRIFIQDLLNAPVYDQYGCGEIFWLAAECKKQKGLHFFYDIRHIEFLDQNYCPVTGSDFGNVILTDLENKIFPIIRYENNDKGRWLNTKCTCGINLPLIDKIKGRSTDNIRTPSGIIVDGVYLTTIFDDFPNILEGFQIIQYKDYSIELNIIKSGGIEENDPRFVKINKILLIKVNNEIPITINFVDKLISDRGKQKFIISYLEI